MALSRPSLAFSLLFLSFLVIASADGDASSKYGFDGIPADSPQAKPDGEEKPNYGTKPNYYKPQPVEKEKPDYGTKPDYYKPKPMEKERPDYGTKPDYYKPKPVDKEKPDYAKKPEVVESKPEGQEKPNYGTKQDIYTPKPEEKSDYDKKPYVAKPKPEGEEKPNFGATPYNYKPKPEEKPGYGVGQKKPDYDTKPEEEENRPPIGVQGLVLCKSGSNYYPIQGALAKITCKAVDEVGAEKTLSVCSGATDAKGYYFATMYHPDNLKLRECKAYLQSSPLNTCNVPTNVNKGIDGALLSAFRVLKDKRIKLYSVGPFFYSSSETNKPAANGY